MQKIILIARARTSFMSLSVKTAKKRILARLAVWQGEDKCLKATDKAATILTNKSVRIPSPLLQWRV